VALAAERLGVAPARIAKSLLFRTRAGAYAMLVCPGDKHLSSAVLRQVIGAKVSMTDAEETERVTGFRPGGVCPFGLEGVELFLDEDLGLNGTVYPAAGNDATGVEITLEALARVTGGRVVAFAAG